MKGIYIGRFQPFHNGHLKYLRRIARMCDELIIVIGSRQEHHTGKNPFTVDDRKKMLSEVLRRENIGNARIVSAIDYPGNNERWYSLIKKKVGSFDIVFCGENKVVQQIFSEKGYKTDIVERYDGLSGTDIRKKIAKGAPWEKLVPEPILQEMEKLNAVERIKRLFLPKHL